MRIEQAYPGEALRSLGHQHDGRRRSVVYCTTGETVLPGAYHCTFCGSALRLDRQAPLPLCPDCDCAEFIAAVRLRCLIRDLPSLDEQEDEPSGVGAKAA
jgi:hypothetical protein